MLIKRKGMAIYLRKDTEILHVQKHLSCGGGLPNIFLVPFLPCFFYPFLLPPFFSILSPLFFPSPFILFNTLFIAFIYSQKEQPILYLRFSNNDFRIWNLKSKVAELIHTYGHTQLFPRVLFYSSSIITWCYEFAHSMVDTLILPL